MRFHKSERAFFILIILMCGIGILLYRVHVDLGLLAATPLDASASELVAILGRLNHAAIWVLIASIVCGLLLIYPQIRTEALDRGKLQIITQDLSERSQTLEHAALTDSLTGMQNRRYFDEALKEYLVQFDRIQRPVGLMIIDLDHFKAVNDTHGHDIGDVVLQEVARCLRDYTRYHDVVARLGGEEFAVLAPNMDAELMIKLANRIRKAIATLEIDLGDVKLTVTVSIGLAIWDRRETSKDLYRRADKMLYAAKNMGRNRVCA
ncbi:two-component system cell cycle response regulator [Ochrobactrum sp. 19YEA23]|uniref:GGDEF domain-containing protein n=1 Tax=Ochrobactrum sp. 19YEA23 TaxID=3039854 RepID=UPI00247990B2|nr:two-component system cell cycle response regulator [Ochrobactrum sp. 19YEA23]